MISISNHLSKAHKDVPLFLDGLVEEMWIDLNPNDRFGKPTKRALITRAQALSVIINEKKYIDKVGKDASERHLKCADYLSDTETLKKVVTAKPSEFKDVICLVNSNLDSDDLYLVSGDKCEIQPFGNLLLKLFNYNTYRRSNHCYERYKKLGFTEATCPYCNEFSVRIIKVKKLDRQELVMLCDIDHFYPKHMFPYLALSFYNHIPSCKTCNQTFKGGKSFDIDTHIHPYHQCFDSVYDFKFNYSILSNKNISKVRLANKTDFPDELASVLQLESRYEGSTNLARTPKLIDILSKREHLLREATLSPCEQEMLINALADFGLVKNKEDILSNMYSKLHRDIVKTFDIHDILGLVGKP